MQASLETNPSNPTGDLHVQASGGKPPPSPPTARTLGSREAILDAFAAFRDELDEKHDRRERLVKASRDVTNQSKKVIFQLHR